MANQNLSHRINELRSKGILILSLEGNIKESFPFFAERFTKMSPEQIEKNWKTPYTPFEDGEIEYRFIFGFHKQKLLIKLCVNAYEYAQRENIVSENNLDPDNIQYEVHCIEDNKNKKTHYFALPSSKYI